MGVHEFIPESRNNTEGGLKLQSEEKNVCFSLSATQFYNCVKDAYAWLSMVIGSVWWTVSWVDKEGYGD